jgi:hypothetical protein
MKSTEQAVWRLSAENRIRALLIGATIAAYAPSLRNGLVFDDNQYVTNNPHVTAGLSADNFVWAWTTRYASNWHPLTWISLQVDSQLFGLENPWGFHLTNLLLHVANTLLLFSILRRSTGCLWPSGIVAALFALHPLHVESVAWVAERKDLLSTLFGFSAMWFYLRYVAQRSLVSYAMVFATFALSLLSKPMLVTLPFVLLLLDYWPLKRGARAKWREVREKRVVQRTIRDNMRAATEENTFPFSRLFMEKLSLLGLSVVSSAATIWAQHAGGAVRTLEQVPFQYRISNALVGYAAYLAQAFWPVNLTVFYPLAWEGLPLWKPIGAAVLLAIVTILVAVQYRLRPYLLVGWLWYLGMLIPVIGLVQVGIQARADRYSYVPLVGIFVMVVWGLSELMAARGFRRPILLLVAAFLMAACFVGTWVQVGFWLDEYTLWSHAAEVTPDNAIAHNNAGKPLLDRVVLAGTRMSPSERRTMLAEAERQFATAVRIHESGPFPERDPDYTQARYNLGLVLERQAILTEAELIQINPKGTDALLRRARIEELQEKYKAASAIFSQLAKIHPDDAEVYLQLVECLNRLAAVYAEAGDFDRAIATAKEALAAGSGGAPPAITEQIQNRIRLYESKKTPHR